MTYCVGVLLNDGIVLLSDTRTNAGFDNIASYKKMFVFQEPGERVIALMTAGSLSVTQTVIARLRDAIDDPDQTETPSIMKASTMLEVAHIIGDTLSRVTSEVSEKLERMKQGATASMILAGQRRGGGPRMFLIYPEGNFIEATEDTPFLQIGEHKYGKPILDRVVRKSMPIEDARKALLLSMDSTLRSNLSVGMPLDLAVIRKDELGFSETRRFEPGDPSFSAMSDAWSRTLREGFSRIEI
ncbi:peptidase [Sphingosinicella soli]|uniref:Putative proteasome-type protease n=1 Tax=Sphingosinicella soli TaxID=333708 RepID=A0A7W7B3C7_9SPHN|nr:peptidase [Sphingosinicella soli]MBB4632207.1 putative proteasome-type protease [Sphingosinicella soli]